MLRLRRSFGAFGWVGCRLIVKIGRVHRSTGVGRIASRAMKRQCSRPGCAELAAATLTYVYARQVAWLDGLAPERDPHAYDLCDRHAARVGVPNGWSLDDRRASELLTLLAG